MNAFQELRHQMVETQIASRGIHDKKVLEALEKVPREAFIPTNILDFAYDDTALPIDEGQTISQPFIVALMMQEAHIKPQDKVLEIGTGSGYSTALLSELCSHVYSIEWYPKLAELARERLKQLGYKNITLSLGDGTLGWEEFAPYDAILVTAGGPEVPSSLLKQLTIGGRLIMPVGLSLESQKLMRITRQDEENYHYETLCSVRFVPLLGKEGWE